MARGEKKLLFAKICGIIGASYGNGMTTDLLRLGRKVGKYFSSSSTATMTGVLTS